MLLLGETDVDGLPTGTRTLITANYPVDQELGRGGELLSALAMPPVEVTATPLLTATPISFSGPDVQIIRVTTSEGQISRGCGCLTAGIRR